MQVIPDSQPDVIPDSQPEKDGELDVVNVEGVERGLDEKEVSKEPQEPGVSNTRKPQRPLLPSEDELFSSVDSEAFKFDCSNSSLDDVELLAAAVEA